MQPSPPPLPPAGYAPPTRRSRPPAWIVGCGGCGVIALILVLVAEVVGINSFTNTFNNRPPRDFPGETGASVSDNFSSANGHSSETLVIDDPNFLTHVETYYQSALHANGWTVQAADPSQAVSGDRWQFSRTGSSAPGVITFVTRGAITEITVQNGS